MKLTPEQARAVSDAGREPFSYEGIKIDTHNPDMPQMEKSTGRWSQKDTSWVCHFGQKEPEK